MDPIVLKISEALNLKSEYVDNVITLMDEGNTIPFIARYRKEMHGSMDDTQLRALEELLKKYRNLEERRTEVIRSIEKQGKLTEELRCSIGKVETLAEIEDLYLPYKQKRRTRATIAKEKGLEPLSDLLFSQGESAETPEQIAEKYLNEEAGVITIQDALSGASDILAERISEDAELRKQLRAAIHAMAKISTVMDNTEDEKAAVYSHYKEFSQPLDRLLPHQTLAINRGEREGFLKVHLDYEHETMIQRVRRHVIYPGSFSMAFLRDCCADSFERLIAPSLERELRSAATEIAEESAIHNFSLNLRPLLMQPPVKGFVTMGLDPGYQHGCKVAVVDGTGKVLDTTVVYPTFGERRREEAIRILRAMILKYNVKHLAIGNGTASRETEAMAVDLIKTVSGVSYMIVSEAGASVYSASKLAAEEFPQYDVNLRSAVSIARRLQDPLAELVKIDPKAIGVGQYQHDVSEKNLDESLAGVVEDCVNEVGVDLNTASFSLLTHISGLNQTTAKNIVTYREENGAFTSRKQLLKVPKLGPKAYQQSAGFLRVPESENILDNTAVHPESYEAAGTLLTLCGYTAEDVKRKQLQELPVRLKKIGSGAAERCAVGIPTLNDIVSELMKPGRDPRSELPQPVLRTDVLELSDIKPGMILTGTVRNVIDFGVFVDIGVHQDGLVHVSQVCNKFIKHPSEVVSVGDVVKVSVLEVDEKRKRISLSMKNITK